MKFLYTISAAAFATLVSAQIKQGSIGLMVIRSGSPIHLSSISAEGSDVFIGQGPFFSGMILPDGRIRTGGTDSWLTVNSEGKVVIGSPPLNWGVEDGDYLTAKDKSFVAVKEGDKYSIYTVPTSETSASADSIPFSLRIIYSNSEDGEASSEASSETATITSSPANNETATDVPVVTETVTKCHEDGTCTTGVPQVNGAAAIGSFAGAAAAVVGAALFL